MIPATVPELHSRGVRAIAAYHWRRGSYLKLSDSLPIRYTVHGAASGQKRPSNRDHVPGVPSYEAYFERAVWVAVRVEE